MTANARQKAFRKRTDSLRNKLMHISHTTNSTNAILCFSDDPDKYTTVAGYPYGPSRAVRRYIIEVATIDDMVEIAPASQLVDGIANTLTTSMDLFANEHTMLLSNAVYIRGRLAKYQELVQQRIDEYENR
ncbi:unnamed protein product [Arabidopsis halleri]